MIYATAGVAAADARLDTAYAIVQPAPTPTPLSATHSGLMVGWTAGIGGGWAYSRDWSLGAEYRHVDLGARGFSTGIVDATNVPFVGSNSGSMHDTVDQVTVRANWRLWD